MARPTPVSAATLPPGTGEAPRPGMSSSRHPVALDVERRVGGATRLLATVMALPLIDGIFPALVLAGALSSPVGIVEIGLLVFGGSATVAVILAEMDGTAREQARTVLAVGVPVIAGAVLTAALAPTIRELVDPAILERFAALVILAVAARTASARVGEWLPRPAVIITLGLVASLRPAGASLAVQLDPDLMARAAAAAGVGVGFALFVALTSPWLRNAVDLDRFRFGSAVALGILPLSFLGVLPENAPVALAVLAVTALLALNPGRARTPEEEYEPDPVDITAAFADGGASQGVDTEEPPEGPAATAAADGAEEGEERAPWL